MFDLPDPPAYTLTRAPLVQALAQVRYPLIASFETMAGIAPLQELVRARFPYMEQIKTQEISILGGPGGPAAGASESTSWNLTSDDGYSFTISAGIASLSVGSEYSSVSDFAEVFREVLEALMKSRVPRCDRLGVRYLSIAAALPGDSRSWSRWFRPELVGWSGTSVLAGEASASAISQVQVSSAPTGDLALSPADVGAVVRHGFVPSGTMVPGIPPVTVEEPSYLIDVDISTSGHQSFNIERLLGQFAAFHSEIDRFFYWSLTEEGGEYFGLEDSNR